MVTNTSSLGQDLGALGQSIGGDGGVLPGDPAAMAALAEHLTSLGSAFERAGQGFQSIDDGGWTGQAAEGFRSWLDTCPPKWFRAADAFSSAGKSVQHFADILAEAKRAAEQAQQRLDAAKEASEAALARHAEQVDAYNERVSAANQGGPHPGRNPGKFVDPAAGDRAAAEQALADAKARVKAAGDSATQVLLAAREAAPAEPGIMAQWGANAADSAEQFGRSAWSFASGAAGSVASLSQLVRMASPFDPHKLTHPAQAGEAATTLAMGLAGAVTDPYAAAKTVVDVDGWRTNPSKTMGSMVPDALLSLAGGAGVASRMAGAGQRLGGDAGELAKTTRNVPTTPPAAQPGIPHQNLPQGSPIPTRETGDFGPQPTHHEPDTPTSQEPAPEQRERTPAAWEDYRPGDDAYDGNPVDPDFGSGNEAGNTWGERIPEYDPDYSDPVNPPSNSDTWNPPESKPLSPEHQAWARQVLEAQSRDPSWEEWQQLKRLDPYRKVD